MAAPRDGFAMLVGSRGFPSYPAGFAKWPANNLQLSCVRREQQFCGAGLRVRIRTRPACNLYLSLTEHGPARTRLGRRTRRPRSARNAGRGWSLELQPLRLVIPSGHSAHASPSPGLSLPVGEAPFRCGAPLTASRPYVRWWPVSRSRRNCSRRPPSVLRESATTARSSRGQSSRSESSVVRQL